MKYCTINTHCSLYKYTRLLFSIALALALFERVMDTILQEVTRAICYIDDILVMEKMEAEHLQNLSEVLECFQQHGVRMKRNKCHFMQESV